MELRRCHATKADGSRCHAWAVWGDSRDRCVRHGGKSPYPPKLGPYKGHQRARYVPCQCEAYAWPHRPGGGLCRWPDAPHYRWPKPAGTHSWPRPRNKELWAFARLLKKEEMWLKRIAALPRRREILALFDRQPSPRETLDEAIRLLVAEGHNNGSPPQE